MNESKFCKSCGARLEISMGENPEINEKPIFTYNDEIVKSAQINDMNATGNKEHDLEFKWWTAWAWLGLTLGNLLLFVRLEGNKEIALILVVINTILMILILRFNKYAFLTATVLSLNPLLWIFNGIYLKNRWNHPKINNKNSL